MIIVNNLVKRFGVKTVLRGVDFQVEPGEIVALLGSNGTGKTTFLRILASLSRPTGGDVCIAGCRLPAQSEAVRSRLGFVSHQPLLYGDLTTEENLYFYGRVYAIPNIEQRVSEVLDMLGLDSHRRDLVRTLSRGMQQRLSIGRAVLHDPQVLLFDEPYTGLDQNASVMLDEMLSRVAARGRIVVITSHDLTHIEDVATRYDILGRGLIVASTTREKLGRGSLLTFYRQTFQGA